MDTQVKSVFKKTSPYSPKAFAHLESTADNKVMRVPSAHPRGLPPPSISPLPSLPLPTSTPQAPPLSPQEKAFLKALQRR